MMCVVVIVITRRTETKFSWHSYATVIRKQCISIVYNSTDDSRQSVVYLQHVHVYCCVQN